MAWGSAPRPGGVRPPRRTGRDSRSGRLAGVPRRRWWTAIQMAKVAGVAVQPGHLVDGAGEPFGGGHVVVAQVQQQTSTELTNEPARAVPASCLRAFRQTVQDHGQPVGAARPVEIGAFGVTGLAVKRYAHTSDYHLKRRCDQGSGARPGHQRLLGGSAGMSVYRWQEADGYHIEPGIAAWLGSHVRKRPTVRREGTHGVRHRRRYTPTPDEAPDGSPNSSPGSSIGESHPRCTSQPPTVPGAGVSARTGCRWWRLRKVNSRCCRRTAASWSSSTARCSTATRSPQLCSPLLLSAQLPCAPTPMSLAAALATWGVPATLDQLVWEGALLALECATGRMWAARDHLGIKPLYRARFSAGVAFASEIKALIALPGCDQVQPISPGTAELCDAEGTQLETTCWWELEGRAGRQISIKDAKQEVLETLRHAVHCRYSPGTLRGRAVWRTGQRRRAPARDRDRAPAPGVRAAPSELDRPRLRPPALPRAGHPAHRGRRLRPRATEDHVAGGCLDRRDLGVAGGRPMRHPCCR